MEVIVLAGIAVAGGVGTAMSVACMIAMYSNSKSKAAREKEDEEQMHRLAELRSRKGARL